MFSSQQLVAGVVARAVDTVPVVGQHSLLLSHATVFGIMFVHTLPAHNDRVAAIDKMRDRLGVGTPDGGCNVGDSGTAGFNRELTKAAIA
jgi:hypothetical protein